MTNIWHLNNLETPDRNGKYLVRLGRKHDLLSVYSEVEMDFVDGQWVGDVEGLGELGMFIHSWRCL